jgi:manganese/zinc/iron transport system substrate-binding protein
MNVNCRVGLTVLVLVLSAGMQVGCSPTSSSGSSRSFSGRRPIKVVCTTGLVADMVKRVGGEEIDVFTLMGEGIDPHLYKASPGDIDRLGNADVVFFNGLHLEGKLAEILERMGEKKPVIGVADRLPKDRLLADADGIVDPHFWFDISLWREAVGEVAAQLSTYDPEKKEVYSANAATYQAELAALDEEVRSKIGGIPAERRVLVTAHDAFGYFARAYGLQVRSLLGISTEAEAGLKEINALVTFLCEKKIGAVFVETILSEKSMESLIDGCKARDHTVVFGGELYSDALGKAGTPVGTYAGIVRHNVERMVESLK